MKALHVLPDAFEAVLALEWVRAGGAEDGPTARQDAARGLDRELLVRVLERAAPAVAEADDRVAIAVDSLAHDGTDHRVEAGAVTAAGEDPDAHRASTYRQSRAAHLPVIRPQIVLPSATRT